MKSIWEWFRCVWGGQGSQYLCLIVLENSEWLYLTLWSRYQAPTVTVSMGHSHKSDLGWAICPAIILHFVLISQFRISSCCQCSVPCRLCYLVTHYKHAGAALYGKPNGHECSFSRRHPQTHFSWLSNMCRRLEVYIMSCSPTSVYSTVMLPPVLTYLLHAKFRDTGRRWVERMRVRIGTWIWWLYFCLC